MAKVVVKSKVKKVKRKFPVEIVAPEYLNKAKIGSSEITDPTVFIGKTIKMNLMYVTSSVKNQNIRLTFKIVDVKSGLALTQVSVYEQIPYYLRRFVKKGSDLLEDSFVTKTKDGHEVRVKPFVVTKENVSSLVMGSLREKTREQITKEIGSKIYDEFMASVINGKFQNLLRNEVKKIYPLKSLEFKKVELITKN
jgi:small subunit ribosomal protein S3Ae